MVLGASLWHIQEGDELMDATVVSVWTFVMVFMATVETMNILLPPAKVKR